MSKSLALPMHLKLGLAGEKEAKKYLQKRLNFKILELNWRPDLSNGQFAASLELDIVASDADTIVFCEVKTRSVPEGYQLDASHILSQKKMNCIQKAASYYLSENNLWAKPCRIDLLCISNYPSGKMDVEHIKNVFELAGFGSTNNRKTRPTLGGGDTAWQPW